MPGDLMTKVCVNLSAVPVRARYGVPEIVQSDALVAILY